MCCRACKGCALRHWGQSRPVAAAPSVSSRICEDVRAKPSMLSNSLICSQPHLRQGLDGRGRNPSQRTALSLAGDFATSQRLITPSILEFETAGLF